jgi:hypothetical protein
VWLIYALGGGWGHLTRAAALARIAQRERPVRILTNSPHAAAVSEFLPELDLTVLDAAASAEATRAGAIREIGRCRPQCLIVDTFPRGLGGELTELLPSLGTRKVLVHRDLNPRYVAAAGLREFVAANYALVLVPGAGEGAQFGDLPGACQTDPWLLRSCEELRPGKPGCVLVCAGGNRSELGWYGEVVSHLAGRVPVRSVAPECPPGCPPSCWVRYWPAMDLYGSAAAVIGGAGYNTVQECRAWGVPLIARAWQRKYDCQAERAARAGVRVVTTAREAAEAALEIVGTDDTSFATRRPEFRNGAADAVERIAGGAAR